MDKLFIIVSTSLNSEFQQEPQMEINRYMQDFNISIRSQTSFKNYIGLLKKINKI